MFIVYPLREASSLDDDDDEDEGREGGANTRGRGAAPLDLRRWV